MINITLKVFDVGNGDCLLLIMPDKAVGAVDFCRLGSNAEHPLGPEGYPRPANCVFACLTHGHQDHMADKGEMTEMLDFVAQNGGEFWHTVTDMAELLRLYFYSPRVAEGFVSRVPTCHLERLATIASVVADKFPPERIRFVSAEPGQPVNITISSESGVYVQVLGPSMADAFQYIHMLHRVEAGEIKTIDDRIINRTSAVLCIRFGDSTIILGGDALSDNWKDITGRSQADNLKPLAVDVVKASHHGSADSLYPELWDDLFGDKPGVVLVSADGQTKPSQGFLASFSPRKVRGIADQVFCTGLINPQRRPDFLSLYKQPLLDFVSRGVVGFETMRWGTIEINVPHRGRPIVAQPHSSRI